MCMSDQNHNKESDFSLSEKIRLGSSWVEDELLEVLANKLLIEENKKMFYFIWLSFRIKQMKKSLSIKLFSNNK
jgi:hypothetical protein